MSRFRLFIFFLAVITLGLSGTAIRAQENKPWLSAPMAQFDRDIMRLSELAGALAFLQELCGAADATEWPKVMQQLLSAEGNTPERKARIAGSYNSGYRNYALTYRACTPSAKEASKRFLKESANLSGRILDRYGN